MRADVASNVVLHTGRKPQALRVCRKHVQQIHYTQWAVQRKKFPIIDVRILLVNRFVNSMHRTYDIIID